MIDEGLLAYATPRQAEIVAALNANGGDKQRVAVLLGMTVRNIDGRMQDLRLRAASRGCAPDVGMNSPQPVGLNVSKVSTLYDADGEVKLRWIQSKPDSLDVDSMREALGDIADEYRGAVPRIAAPDADTLDDEQMCLYPIGDHHAGMRAWADEAGADWDLEQSERVLVGAMDALVDEAPATQTALIAGLGDFFHADNAKNTTTKGTPVDVTARPHDVFRAGIRMTARVIERALAKHTYVRVIIKRGNHDEFMSLFLAVALESLFANNPRVQVDVEPSPFSLHTFGKSLLVFTHGHRGKPVDWANIIAARHPEIFSKAARRYIHHGHIHNKTMSSLPGWQIESHAILPPTDHWHSAQYFSGRGMSLIVYSSERGEASRRLVYPEALL